MPGTTRGALALAVLAGFAAGAAGGWLAGRWSAPSPPPPPRYDNPLAAVRSGENLVLRRSNGTRSEYRILEVDRHTLRISVDDYPPGGARRTRQLQVSRNFFGVLLILGGDLSGEEAENAVRDTLVLAMEPEDLEVPALGRTLRCWRLEVDHRVQGPMTWWVSDELPVHGLVRMANEKRGTLLEVESFGEGTGDLR